MTWEEGYLPCRPQGCCLVYATKKKSWGRSLWSPDTRQAPTVGAMGHPEGLQLYACLHPLQLHQTFRGHHDAGHLGQGGATIRVDTALGISAIINHSSEEFKEAEMKLEPDDVKNKNSCAKVDKTWRNSDWFSLPELSLQIVTETLRNMNLGAREIMFSRLQNWNENLQLNYRVLSGSQFENRSKANATAVKIQICWCQLSLFRSDRSTTFISISQAWCCKR